MKEMTHICRTMPTKAISVDRSKYFLSGNDWKWCLVVSKEATEQDLLNNNHLEVEDELIWQTVVGISHCPFCGDLPPDVDNKLERPTAEFNHFDHQQY